VNSSRCCCCCLPLCWNSCCCCCSQLSCAKKFIGVASATYECGECDMNRHYSTFFGGVRFSINFCQARRVGVDARIAAHLRSHIAMYVSSYCYVYIACSYCYISSVRILLYMQAQRAAGAHRLPQRRVCRGRLWVDCGSRGASPAAAQSVRCLCTHSQQQNKKAVPRQ
jgi:hypothetical protein